MTEQELASAVCAYLKDLDFQIYQEVQTGRGGPIADIVGKRGPVLWVVECKTRLNATVCAQAARWRPLAHLCSVATRGSYGGRMNVVQWLRDSLKQQGIGIIEVSHLGRSGDEAQELIVSRFQRKVPKILAKHLDEAQTWFAPAGNANGKRWSPFQKTVEQLKELLKRQQGIAMKEAVDQIKHHYKNNASARQSLAFWILRGNIKGVRLDKSTRPHRLYLEEMP